MTAVLICVFLTAAGLELVGITLLIREVRYVRRRWQSHQSGIAADTAALARDPMFQLDPFVTRYGITPIQLLRAIAAVDELFAYRRREALSAILILVGIVVGLVGNVLSVATWWR